MNLVNIRLQHLPINSFPQLFLLLRDFEVENSMGLIIIQNKVGQELAVIIRNFVCVFSKADS